MTDREKAIVSAYTGVTMLAGDKLQIFYEYIEKILGRPVWTHELGNELVWNEIKEKSKDDFLDICKTEKTTGEWIVMSDGTTNYYACSKCGHAGDFQDKFCRECGIEIVVKEKYFDITCRRVANDVGGDI